MTPRTLVGAISILLCVWAMDPAKAQDDKIADKRPKPAARFEMPELAKKVFHIGFPAGQKATIRITSAEETDVDLYVEEMDGTDVVSDIAESKDCLVEFTPLKAKTYRISVINLGQGGNTCTLTHSGKEEKFDFGKLAQTKPIKIAQDESHVITTKLQEGKWAAVWASGDSATDVDIFVFDPDGNEIAKDEHISRDAFVSFLPKQSGTYRIEVRNLGEGDTTCTVKHTTLEEPKKEKANDK